MKTSKFAQLLLMGAFSLMLFSLFPTNPVIAQVKEKAKVIKLKIIKEIDGVKTVVDTTITVTGADQEHLILQQFESESGIDKGKPINFIHSFECDSIANGNHDVMIIKQKHNSDSLKLRWIGGEEIINQDSGNVMIIKHLDGNSHSLSGEKMEWINVEQEVTPFGDSVKVVIIQSSDSMPHEKVMRFVEDKHVDHVFNGDSTKIIIVEHIDKNVNCNDSTKIIFIRDVATDKVIRQEIEINDNGNIRKEITIIAKVMILDIQKDDATDIKKSCVATKIDLEQKNLNVSNLQFYPNPNDGHFTLSFNLPETDKTIIRIFDTNGREIYKDTVRKFSGIYKNDIDISGNNAGVYFMQIVQNGKAITKKIGNYLGHFF